MVLHFFNFISAATGGILLIADPNGGLIQMEPHILQHSPFHDFFIPGIILFSAIGFGSLVAIIFLFLNLKSAALVSLAEGVIIIIWIVTQVLLLQFTIFLQAVYFGTGLMVLIFSFILNILKNEN